MQISLSLSSRPPTLYLYLVSFVLLSRTHSLDYCKSLWLTIIPFITISVQWKYVQYSTFTQNDDVEDDDVGHQNVPWTAYGERSLVYFLVTHSSKGRERESGRERRFRDGLNRKRRRGRRRMMVTGNDEDENDGLTFLSLGISACCRIPAAKKRGRGWGWRMREWEKKERERHWRLLKCASQATECLSSSLSLSLSFLASPFWELLREKFSFQEEDTFVAMQEFGFLLLKKRSENDDRISSER